MNLRWFTATNTFWQWDARLDEWFLRTIKAEPKLQFLDGEQWVDVPCFEQPSCAGEKPV